MSTPRLAKKPALAIMADGVARVSAQGQVTISTALATSKAFTADSGHHQQALNKASSKTIAMKGLATRSAILAISGLELSAS